MSGHGYLGNIDPAFPRNSLCDRISSDPNFRKIYFLITQASQSHYQQISGNSMENFFATEIHGESHPVSMHMIFHTNVLLAKLPNTSTRGLLPM